MLCGQRPPYEQVPDLVRARMRALPDLEPLSADELRALRGAGRARCPSPPKPAGERVKRPRFAAVRSRREAEIEPFGLGWPFLRSTQSAAA